LKVGQCVAPDETCKGVAGSVCPGKYVFECSATGLVLSRQRCRSSTCDSAMKACAPVECYQPMTGGFIEGECKPECTGANACAVEGQAARSGTTFSADVAFLNHGVSDLAVGYSLPAAASLPAIAQCPEVHGFLLFPTGTINVSVELPPEYWAVKLPNAGLPASYLTVVASACSATNRLTDSVTFYTGSEALLIATTDTTAAPFNLIVKP
jgi:hypothetical protein